MGAMQLSALWLFALSAAYTDFRYRKVPNRLIVAAAAGGLAVSALAGRAELAAGLVGLVLGFLLLLPAFILRMVGGGDVKSLAVVGLLTGPHLLWISFLRGAAVGGLAAILLLAARRSGRVRRLLKRGESASGGDARAWTLPYAGILALCAAFSAL